MLKIFYEFCSTSRLSLWIGQTQESSIHELTIRMTVRRSGTRRQPGWNTQNISVNVLHNFLRDDVEVHIHNDSVSFASLFVRVGSSCRGISDYLVLVHRVRTWARVGIQVINRRGLTILHLTRTRNTIWSRFCASKLVRPLKHNVTWTNLRSRLFHQRRDSYT